MGYSMPPARFWKASNPDPAIVLWAFATAGRPRAEPTSGSDLGMRRAIVLYYWTAVSIGHRNHNVAGRPRLFKG